MTQAVPARRDGDTFQSRVFWTKAARLLDPQGNVLRVGFENGPKGFDDVWVDYDPKSAPTAGGAVPIGREHTQCKWHGTPDTYGHASLIDTEFINANAVSFLNRARKAQLGYTIADRGARFRLFTNWRIDRDDPLRQLVSERTHSLRLERLYKGGGASAMGKVRKLWAEHLGIDEDELRNLATVLALSETTLSLDQMRDELDQTFRSVGLRRIPANESAFPYDDLPYQWMTQNRLEFDRGEFRALCEREGLLGDNPEEGPRIFGVKSFEHKTDKLEDRCTAVLNLLANFNERQILSEADWAGALYPALSSFLIDAAKSSETLRLILDTHLSLSFAAGSVLDIKSGRAVELEQRTIGKAIWSAQDKPLDSSWADWSVQTEKLVGSGDDIAVAVSLTHDTAANVRAYVKRALPTVGRLMIVAPSSGPGATAIACGHHAFRLAESLTGQIRTARSEGATGHLHLFMAAPGAFAFFFGQRHVALGALTLYEFDFDTTKDGSYEASLTLPVKKAA